TRVVRNVRALDNCEDLGNGKWSCQLQAEYRDEVLGMLIQEEWQLIEDRFDFVQDGANWRVSDDFPMQYAKASAKARALTIQSRRAGKETPEAPPSSETNTSTQGPI